MNMEDFRDRRKARYLKPLIDGRIEKETVKEVGLDLEKL